MVVRIVMCNREFMTDDAEGESNSHTITPQGVDKEGGARRGGHSLLDGQLEGDVHLSLLGQRNDLRQLHHLRGTQTHTLSQGWCMRACMCVFLSSSSPVRGSRPQRESL